MNCTAESVRRDLVGEKVKRLSPTNKLLVLLFRNLNSNPPNYINNIHLYNKWEQLIAKLCYSLYWKNYWVYVGSSLTNLGCPLIKSFYKKAKWSRLVAYGTYLLLQHSPGRLCLKINHTCSILNGTFYPFLFFPRCLISFGFKHTRHLIKWFIIPKVLVKKGKKFTSHTLGLSANKRRVSLSNRRTNLTNASQIWGKEKGKN